MTLYYFFFFFNDTATTEIYTLSLHDALPIYSRCRAEGRSCAQDFSGGNRSGGARCCKRDRKSTRLNSSHSQISYAVFCLKKKKKIDDSLGADDTTSKHRVRHVMTGAHIDSVC